MPPSVIQSDSEGEIPRPTRRVSSSNRQPTAASSGKDTQALEVAQAENFQLRQQVRKLTIEANSQAVEEKRSSKKPKKEMAEDNNASTEIARLGRKYSLMICPWLNSAIFVGFDERPVGVDPNSEERYASPASRVAGTRAELCDFVPVKLHDLMLNHNAFATNFRHNLQGTRSNALLAVRQKAGLLFGLDQSYFETNFNRASVPELQKLLRSPKGDSDTYPLFAPILFADHKYDPTLKKLFKNPLLPRISRVMLHGKSATSKSKPQTLAEIWQVTEATPGLIACCAIFARFLLSPEEELRQVGKITKINWLEDFISYKRILSGDSKKVKEVFRFFNSIAFESQNTKSSDNDNVRDNKEDFEDAMRAFNDDNEDSEDEDM